MRSINNPTYESNIFGYSSSGLKNHKIVFETTNSQYFRSYSLNTQSQNVNAVQAEYNGKAQKNLNNKESCPCCVNDEIKQIKSINKENVERKMKEIDQQMLYSNAISLKLSTKRTMQVQRYHQEVTKRIKKWLPITL